ncbi:MAG: glycosyltransferase [Myxococcales bacterium]|nr:glycosyltransferase [Myxococcales bacterium]
MKETSHETKRPPLVKGSPVTARDSSVANPGFALEALPAWLLSDIRDQRRTVCLDECGVGRDLATLARVLGPVSLTGIDASEEAIVEARRRFPDFRFKVDTGEHTRQWDVVVQLEAAAQRARVLSDLERLVTMSRRAVVLVFAHGSIDPAELPLILSGGFVLTHAVVSGEAQKWLVAAWALAELPLVRHLSLGDGFPALNDSETTLKQQPRVEQLEIDLTRLRARLAEATRETVATRELLADKQAELEHLAFEVDGLRQQDGELRAELARIHTSKSWALTRPMRTALHEVRKVKDQAEDVLTLARRVTRDVAAGRAREWLSLSRQNEIKRPERPKTSGVSLVQATSKPLFTPTVFMFALVPFDDVGGGQRSAQLARVLAARGYQVVYVYLYKKWNLERGAEEESQVDVPLMTHVHISQVDASTLLRGAAPDSVAIFEVPHPRYEPFFDRANQVGLRTVFELIDAWDTSLGGEWYKPEVMRRFATEAEVAVGTARALVTQLERYGRSDARYLPNAGNEVIFDASAQHARPTEMDPTRRAFVYVGSLYGEWFGWDYIKAAARLCPDSSFYLIGDPPKGLELPNNVRLLGPRKIDEVPAYLAHADAALLPFIPGRISDAVSPIKIFEYLLMGRRVVSTDLPEIRDYPNTTICESVEAFARACRNVEPPEAPPETFIMRNTWSCRADALLHPARIGSVSVVVLGSDSLFDAQRCAESFSLHGPPHLSQLIWVSPQADDARLESLRRWVPELVAVTGSASTIADAWLTVRGQVKSETVLFLDPQFWLTSRACLEEGVQLLENEMSLGAVGLSGRYLDADTGRADAVSRSWLNEQRGSSQGFRRELAYLGARGLFIRRRLLDRLTATPLETGELEGAEFSFRIKAAGLDVAGRSLTGLRAPLDAAPILPVHGRDALLARWKTQRQFFVPRRGI